MSIDAGADPGPPLPLQGLIAFHEQAARAGTVAALAQALSACIRHHPALRELVALYEDQGRWMPLNPLPGVAEIELDPPAALRALTPDELAAARRWLPAARHAVVVPIPRGRGRPAVLTAALDQPADDAARAFLQALAPAAGAHLQRLWAAESQVAHEAWLQAVIDHVAEGVVTVAADGRVIDGNASAARILRLTRDELQSLQPTNPRVPVLRDNGEPYDPQSLAPAVTLRTGEPVYGQLQGVTGPDDTRVWLSVNSAPLYRTGEARPYACILSFQDITELIEAERALRESEKRYRALVDTAPEAIVLIDPEAKAFVDVNRNAAFLFGMPREALIGRAAAEVSPAYQPDGRPSRESAPEYLDQALAGRNPVFDWTHVNAAGEPIHCEVRLSLLPGEPVLVRGSIIDVSERRAAEQALVESERRYRTLVENAPEAIFVFDYDTNRIVEANDHTTRLLGMDRPTLRRIPPKRFNPRRQPDGRSSLQVSQAHAARALAGERPVFEWTFLDADGRAKPCEVRMVRLPSSDRRLIQASMVDISERQRAAEALRASEQRFRALYHDNPSIFITLDPDGVIRSANQFGAEVLGYQAPERVTGRHIDELLLSEERDTVHEHVQACFARPEAVQRWESRVLREDGGSIWVRVNARVMPHPERGPELLLVCQDVTEARNLSAELIYQATHDSLTGLLNRAEFERRLIHALEEARENGSEHALCYVDLDQFKIINDTCGHVAGDELLRQLSSELNRHVGQRDVLARMGGDEFGVLLEHCSGADAFRLAERLRTVVESFPFAWEGRSFRVAASIGVVPVDRNRRSLTDILSLADTACYAAKDEGRNRIHVYHAGDVEMARRHGEMEWVARLRHALDENRLCLYRQPIAALSGTAGGGDHYELLVRLVDEEGEIVPPGAFLPAAEQYNMATTVDQWVVARALDWLQANPWRVAQLGMCSINLSGHSLRSGEFLDFLLQRLDGPGVPAAKICFEITETAAIGNLVQATRFIQAVRQRGCHFALDDFGSGLSSFGYLKNLPVDFLKIDGIFVKDITDDPIDLSVVRAINEIGQVMGKRTIAEFVETEAVMARLAEIGVDYVQGYAVGRPRPLEDDPSA